MNDDETEFLNVDLELRADFLPELVYERMKNHVFDMYFGESTRGEYLFSCEIEDFTIRDADLIINEFCDLVDQFSINERAEWDRCTSRVFDLGYRSRSSENKIHTTRIRRETLSRINAVGAEIVISVYPIEVPVVAVPESE